VAGVPIGRSVGVDYPLLGCEVAVGHGSDYFFAVGVTVSLGRCETVKFAPTCTSPK